MATPFKPPSVDKLASVDVADGEYNKDCEDIQGLVSPSSQGGWEGAGDYKVHCFSLSAWRRVGGPLVRQELTVLRPAPDYEWSAYPELTIHRLRVLLSKDQTRAVFANALKMAESDDELLAVAEELRKPVVIPTARFGNLTLDRSIGWFRGKVEWNRVLIEISFSSDDGKTIVDGLTTADALWNDQAGWKRKVDEYAVQELLPVKNDYWLDDDEEPLTPEQFKARMTLDSISLSSTGEFEFWHDDGDLFLGHSIQISGSLTDGLTRADIPG